MSFTWNHPLFAGRNGGLSSEGGVKTGSDHEELLLVSYISQTHAGLHPISHVAFCSASFISSRSITSGKPMRAFVALFIIVAFSLTLTERASAQDGAFCAPNNWGFYCMAPVLEQQNMTCEYSNQRVINYGASGFQILQDWTWYRSNGTVQTQSDERVTCATPNWEQYHCDEADRWQAHSVAWLDIARNERYELEARGATALAAGASVYATTLANGYEKICNDPPRSDYDEVYEYTGIVDLEPWETFVGESHPFLSDFDAAMTFLVENMHAQLITIERMQGAALDDDALATVQQFEAYESFFSDLGDAEMSIWSMNATLPSAYLSLGVYGGDLDDDDAEFFGELVRHAQSVGGNPIPFDFFETPLPRGSSDPAIFTILNDAFEREY